MNRTVDLPSFWVFIQPRYAVNNDREFFMNTLSKILTSICVSITMSLIAPIAMSEQVDGNLFFHEYAKPVNTQSEKALRKLLLLQETDLAKESISTNQSRLAIARALNLTENAKSYCALDLEIDYTFEGLSKRDFVALYRRLDYVKPDRYHVSRDLWNNEQAGLRDQWIYIGKKYYESIGGAWVSPEVGFWDKINQALRTNGYLEILRNEEAIGHTVFTSDKKYLVLEYEAPKIDGLKPSTGKLVDATCKSRPEYLCKYYLYIDLQGGLFSKGQIVIYRNDEKLFELVNVYACYNENIEVAPPGWLNATRNEDGSYTVTSTVAPIMRHHP